ncbi:hypothetical protein C8R44DRAFT_753215 [Mycena epipterygia]|nr:hypothetical protein C8R44DRAFT_753215 [Mycena epipterygia]
MRIRWRVLVARERELTHFPELRISDFVSGNNNSEARLRGILAPHYFLGNPEPHRLVGCKVHGPVGSREFIGASSVQCCSRVSNNGSTQPSSQPIFELSSTQVFQMTSGIVANGYSVDLQDVSEVRPGSTTTAGLVIKVFFNRFSVRSNGQILRFTFPHSCVLDSTSLELSDGAEFCCWAHLSVTSRYSTHVRGQLRPRQEQLKAEDVNLAVF